METTNKGKIGGTGGSMYEEVQLVFIVTDQLHAECTARAAGYSSS